MPDLEILDARGRWRPLGAGTPTLPETGTLSVRGLAPGETFRIGPVAAVADGFGAVSIRLQDHLDLRCQLGYIPLHRGDRPCGELEVLPDRLTQERFERLRAELQSVWLDLVFDPTGTAAVRGTVPDPRGYWKRLAPLVRSILDEPRMHLDRSPGILHAERARRPSELNTSVMLARTKNRPGRTQVVRPVPVIADHAIVSDTLIRLANIAGQHPQGADVRAGCRRLLAQPLLHEARTLAPAMTHGVRHDPRYRQVAQLRKELRAHLRQRVEGPGDLRHGIKGIDRLYEYWVFLATIRELINRFGPPVPAQLQQLVVPLAHEGVRLELLPGTTVTFENGACAAFEPTITTNPRESWLGLEISPNPTLAHQRKITPDTVVRLPGDPPSLLVIDAKHRGRHLIDAAAVDVHAKYARIRHQGLGVVSHVVVAHPHPDLRLTYAGYRAEPFVPGEALDVGALFSEGPNAGESSTIMPEPPVQAGPPPPPPAPPPRPTEAASEPATKAPTRAKGTALVIVDQRATLPFRGMDLRRLVHLAAPTAGRHDVHVVMPDIPQLIPFASAVERLGYAADRVSGMLRADLVDEVVELIRSSTYDDLVLCTDDPRLIESVAAEDPALLVFDDFRAVPQHAR